MNDTRSGGPGRERQSEKKRSEGAGSRTDRASGRAAPRRGTGSASTDTRDALLAAGRKLFSASGYDGTSIRAITSEAAANLGAVTYHFGSKEELYRAVLADVLGPLPDRIAGAATDGGPVRDRIAGVTRAYLDHLAKHPDLPHLLLQEIAAGKGPPPPVMEVLRRIAGLLTDLMVEGQRTGELRSGDPFLMTLSLVSQPVYFALVRRAIVRLRGFDPLAPEHLTALGEHVAAIAVAGLSAPPEAT